MFCGKCGKQIEDDATVCKWCGEPVESDEESVKGSTPVHEDVQMDPKKTYKKPVNKPIQMTSLGISVGLAALCIYFSGIVNSVLVFLVAAYILLKEQDSWLRAVAVKAVLIVSMYEAINVVINIPNDGMYALNSMVSFIGGNMPEATTLQYLCRFLSDICEIVKNIILIVAGVQALHCNNFKVGFIDRMVNKNIQK